MRIKGTGAERIRKSQCGSGLTAGSPRSRKAGLVPSAATHNSLAFSVRTPHNMIA